MKPFVSSFTGRPFKADSYGAAIMVPILGVFFCDPWWKGLLIVPAVLLVLLPFVLLFRQERAAREEGRPYLRWVHAQWMLGLLILAALYPITMYVHLTEVEFRYLFGWYPADWLIGGRK